MMMEILEHQYFPNRQGKICSELTKVKYRRAVAWLGEMLGAPAKLEDFTDDNLTGLMYWLTNHRKQKPATVNGSYKCLVALWKWCLNRRLDGVSFGPTVARLKEPRRAPRAWTAEEFGKLVRAAMSYPGRIGGMTAPTWWLTLFAVEMSIAVRSSELRSIRWEWIDLDARVMRVPAEFRKGQFEDGTYRLTSDLIDWLRPLAMPSGRVFGDQSMATYYNHWHKLLALAELPRTRKSMTQGLRILFATQVYANGGDASAALGHKNPAIARESYIDPGSTLTVYGDLIPANWRPLGMVQRGP